MAKGGTLYIERDSSIHSMDGSVKLLLLIVWTVAVFSFMDLRIFTLFFLGGMALLRAAKIPFKSVKPLFFFVVMFTIFNSVFLIAVTPQYGSELSGSYTTVFTLMGRELTAETLWFALSLSMKYMAIFPITMLFIFTTHPSRFASSLNKLGISYRVAYAINIALRYIPDVSEEFKNIMHAQEARGVAFRKGEAPLMERLVNYNTILIPLVLSSLNRVEVVTNAMNLRGFGREKKRTWYSGSRYTSLDFSVMGAMALLLVLVFYLKNNLITGFWYPFQ